MRVVLILSMLLACCAVAHAGEDTLDFAGKLSPISPDNLFHEPGYYVWCNSCIKGEDGKYYLFYARWKTGAEGRAPGDEKKFGDMRGWLKYCEIASAVSDSPTGPFKPLGMVIKGTGDTSRWDFNNAHNAHIKRFGDKVYLYFISVAAVKDQSDWLQNADAQRVGVAVADSVADMAKGKFKRCDVPLIEPDNVHTFCRTVNPSVTQGRDGKYLMMYKSRNAPTGGFMIQSIATADHPDGPFTHAGPALDKAEYDAEDPYFWYDAQRDRYYAIVKDFSPKLRGLSPQFGALALITSDDGIHDWKPAKHPLVSLREYTDDKGVKHKLANLERPQLLLDEKGVPVALYCAAGEKDPFKGTPSFCLAFKINWDAK